MIGFYWRKSAYCLSKHHRHFGFESKTFGDIHNTEVKENKCEVDQCFESKRLVFHEETQGLHH